MPETTQPDWSAIRKAAGPYPPEAFVFVQQGLRHTIEKIRRQDSSVPREGRHVSGQELCLGLRDFAILQFGRLARAVLERWRIHRTEDFGRIVFAMVDGGLMRKTDDDSIDDFKGVYEFDEVFDALEVG